MKGLLDQARLLAANPAAVAMMVGATQHKSETAAKTELEDGEKKKSDAKVSIELGADGKQTIQAKGVPLDDFEANAAKAYESPQRELATIMDHMAAGLNRDKIRQQLQSYQGRLALAREGGGGPLTARISAALGRRSGSEGQVDEIAMRRARQLAQFHREAGGIFDDARMAHNAARADKVAQTAAERQRRTALLSAINKSDLSNLTTDNVAAEAGLDPQELTPKDITAIEARRASLTVKEARDRRVRVTKAINDADLEALTPENVAGIAGAGELTQSERELLGARKKTLEDKQARDDAREARADAREARALAAEARAADAAARASRSEERSISRDERNRSLKQIDHVGEKIDKNNEEITKAARDLAKPDLDEAERAVILGQQKAKIEENKKLRAQLDSHLAEIRGTTTEKPVATGKKGALLNSGGVLQYVPKKK